MQKITIQPVNLPPVTLIALILLAVTVIANLPALDGQEWPEHLPQIVIWLLVLAILLLDARSKRCAMGLAGAVRSYASSRTRPSFLFSAHSEKTILISLVMVALFSAASYYHFGTFHGNGRFLHYHEFYHYYMGSKYIQELGYDGLYCATYHALIEDDRSLHDQATLIKNLRTYQLEGGNVCLQRSLSIVSHFSEPRWQEFKGDIRFFQSRMPPDYWRIILVDHGYNATPFWTWLGSFFTTHLELNDRALFLLAMLDPLLIVLMIVLICYAFGLPTAMLFAIFLFAGFFAVFDITGGAFLRQLWLASLVGFVCFFKINRLTAAGLALAVAVLDRVFPLLFLLLPAVLFIGESVRRRSLRHGQTRLLTAFALSLVLLAGLSAIATTGVTAWKSFHSNIAGHERGFYLNQISLRNLFIVDPAASQKITGAGWDESSWVREREFRDTRTRNTLLVVRAVTLLLLIAFLVKQKEPLVSLGLLAFTPFLFLYPANYYCTFLAVIIICWQSSFRLALTLIGLQPFFWILHAFLPSPTQMELLHWIISLCLALTFAAFLFIELRRHASGNRVFTRSILAILIVGALSVVGVLVADANTTRGDRDWRVLDLTAKDVRSQDEATAQTELMAKWGSGWSRNDHLVILAQGPGAQATVNVPVRQEETYTVRIDYTSSPVFGVVQLSVNDQAPREPVNLYSTRVGIIPVLYQGIMLNEGPNDFRFSVVGKDPASDNHHLAVDRIVLIGDDSTRSEEHSSWEETSRRASLDRALSWIRTHPADFFDGGYNSVCAEIVALYRLSSDQNLSNSTSICLQEIEERITRLNANHGYRIQPGEYEMLAAATHIARQLGLELVAFDSYADEIRQWASNSIYIDRYGHRPQFLCRYLERLDAAGEAPCDIDQSVIFREYANGKFLEIIAGAVERDRAPWVMHTLHSITRDVCALSDFGNQPLPRIEVFADQEFWAQLCDHGIRWGRETGDILTVARLVLLATLVGVESTVPSFQPAVVYLLDHQQPDGCFGPTTPTSPNAFRDGVLAVVMAISTSG